MTVQEALSQAACIDCLTPSQQQAIQTLAALATIENGGVVGGGAGASPAPQVFCGFYGGGTPTDTPTTDAAIAYDKDSPFDLWFWDGSAWY